MPSPEAIRLQLESILASRGFENAPRLRELLRYTTDRTLAGAGGELKEYAIGIDVFGKGEQFDPKADSIVRVTIGKLRLKLNEYYLNHPESAVQIQYPSGSYSPAFIERNPALATKPRSLFVLWS